MLNTYVNHGDVIRAIVTELNNGRIIEAIKMWRVQYGVGLKEAKDAIDALRVALGIATPVYPVPVAKYVVFSMYSGENYWSRYPADDKCDADSYANSVVNDRDEVIVAQVVSQSVTTRSMKNV